MITMGNDTVTAAGLAKDFGHKSCLDKHGSGLGWLMSGGAALYAQSHLNKK